MTVEVNPADVMLWIVAAVTFGITALVFFIIAVWQRHKRWEAEDKHRALGHDVRYFVKQHLLDKDKYDRQAVLDFIKNNEPGFILLHAFGASPVFWLPPKEAPEENGSFSDRSP